MPCIVSGEETELQKAAICETQNTSLIWMQQNRDLGLLHELLLQNKPQKNFLILVLLHSHFTLASLTLGCE